MMDFSLQNDVWAPDIGCLLFAWPIRAMFLLTLLSQAHNHIWRIQTLQNLPPSPFQLLSIAICCWQFLFIVTAKSRGSGGGLFQTKHVKTDLHSISVVPAAGTQFEFMLLKSCNKRIFWSECCQQWLIMTPRRVKFSGKTHVFVWVVWWFIVLNRIKSLVRKSI